MRAAARFGAAVLLGVSLVGIAPLAAAAAPQTFHVTVDGGNVGTVGSLPWAIFEANLNGNPGETDIIDFVGYPGDTITVAALTPISQELLIDGPGRDALTIRTTTNSVLLTVDPGGPTKVPVEIRDLTLSTTTAGAATLYTIGFADTTVANARITGPSLGIYSLQGSIEVQNTIVTGADVGVRVIADGADDLGTFTDLDVSDNVTNGLELSLAGGSTVNVLRGTFSNMTDINGYGIYADTVTNSHITIDGATAEDDYGCIYINASGTSTVDVSNTVLTPQLDGGTCLDLRGEGTAAFTGTANTIVGDGDETTQESGMFVTATGDSSFVFTDTSVSLTANPLGATANGTASVEFLGDTVVADNDDSFDLSANVDATILLDGGIVTGNTATYGGGMSVSMTTRGKITIRNTLIQGNTASFGGGGIIVDDLDGPGARFELLDSRVLGNSTGDEGGGLLFDEIGYDGDEATAYIARTTIAGNTAPRGGGIGVLDYFGDGPALVVDSSTISGNTVTGRGGGLWIQHSSDEEYDTFGVVRIIDSTVSGNRAGDDGGAMWFEGNGADETRLELLHSTFTGNTAADAADGVLLSEDADLLLSHTILADAEISLWITDPLDTEIEAEYSIVVDSFEGDEVLLAGPGMQFGVSPRLGPLAANGGPTDTHLLLAGSPALDTGDPAFVPPPALDQRGDPRVIQRIDIGAVEMPATLPATGGAQSPLWLLIAAGLVALGVGAVTTRRILVR